jgi:hypothetical protein
MKNGKMAQIGINYQKLAKLTKKLAKIGKYWLKVGKKQ